jgi:hypothetical protein
MSAYRAALVAVAVAAGLATPAHSAPFGIKAGTPISSLRVISRLGERYYVVRPPQPNTTFDKYIVDAAPGVGACRVTAETKPLAITPAELQDRFTALRKNLSLKYGVGRGIIPAEPERLMNIAPRDLDLLSDNIWKSTPEHPLPDRLGSIYLRQLHTLGEQPRKLSLTYVFENAAQCDNFVRGQDTTGL